VNVKTTLWWALLIGLLLTTFGLRVAALDAVPPGLTHDEASNGHDSAAILRGVHRLYFPVGYGHEPLYNYSVAALTVFLGQGIFTLRFTTVLWSLATWTLTVALARRWWGRRAALWTAAALTVGFWPLMMARLGLRAPALPALLAASALACDHGLTARAPRRAWAGYLVAGACLGLSFYTYMASRGMPLLYLAFLGALALFDRRTLRRVWPGVLALLGVAGAVGFPLFYYLKTHPNLEQRIAQLGGALTAARGGDWRPLWQNVTDSLPLLLWKADPRWLYHVSERPALEPFLALAFMIGLGVAVWRVRDRRCSFTLLWLGGGMAPALLTTVEYNTLHAIAALPPTFLLIALGVDNVWLHIRSDNFISRLSRFSRLDLKSAQSAESADRKNHFKKALPILLAVAFLGTGIEAAHAYFVTWGQNRDVRVSYHHHVVALGRHLDANPATTPVAITSLYPGEVHDPYTMEVTLRRTDLSLRWSDGRSALFFPRGATRLYTEEQSALPPELTGWLAPTLTPAITLTFRPQDLPPAVYGYDWDADAAWDSLTAPLARTVVVGPGDAAPGSALVPSPCPVAYGDVVALVGYAITPTTLTPGGALTVMTAWEVLAAQPEELALFVHLLDGHNTILTQVDRLDAPSWQWQPGDRFVQLYRLTLPDALPPGDYGLSLGFYRRADFQRLPVTNAGMADVNHSILPLGE